MNPRNVFAVGIDPVETIHPYGDGPDGPVVPTLQAHPIEVNYSTSGAVFGEAVEATLLAEHDWEG